MPKTTLKFKVTPGPGVLGYWIAVDKDDVRLGNGTGQIAIATGESHLLIWWFTGQAGSKVGIEGKRGETVIVEVKESTIPRRRRNAAGRKRFTA